MAQKQDPVLLEHGRLYAWMERSTFRWDALPTQLFVVALGVVGLPLGLVGLAIESWDDWRTRRRLRTTPCMVCGTLGADLCPRCTLDQELRWALNGRMTPRKTPEA